MNDPAPLRSVHTSNLPQILHDLRSSLAMTTYQAGKLVILRNDQGVLNTHFRAFNKPMGLAIAANCLAIGTAVDIWEFHNVPAAGGRSTSGSQTDACFLPRICHVTGDIQIHEMAWVGDQLWFANTAFSCLATRSDQHSFQPQWRPRFVPQLLPGDCCHINGLAVRDGRVRYVTALGETGTPDGWRENKRNGGVLIDVADDQIICRGLSMPHSPRWYRDRLWLLESGEGSLGIVDLASGRYEPVAHLPGFTRGLCFHGPLAFVGLSQVRESATFSGIPLVDRLQQRTCGVWVVHIETGQTVAYCEFQDAVQEVFAVELLPGLSYPDVINDDHQRIASSYVLPDEALSHVPPDLRR